MSAQRQLLIATVQYAPNVDHVLIVANESVLMDDGSRVLGQLVNISASQAEMGPSWGDADVIAACALDPRYVSGWTVVAPTPPEE